MEEQLDKILHPEPVVIVGRGQLVLHTAWYVRQDTKEVNTLVFLRTSDTFTTGCRYIKIELPTFPPKSKLPPKPEWKLFKHRHSLTIAWGVIVGNCVQGPLVGVVHSSDWEEVDPKDYQDA